MRCLDLSLADPAENLALDEALLRELGEDPSAPETLRFWESPVHCVVLGALGKRTQEVDLEACAAAGVPVLRRGSGGGTVLLGPGCLSYALVLSFERHPDLLDLRHSNLVILTRVLEALAIPGAAIAGLSDLAINRMKFSGSAQRRMRHGLLHHGCILYHFDLARISRLLRQPERQPEYRAGRPHERFLRNTDLSGSELKARLREAWGACDWKGELPDLTALMAEQYGNPAWVERF